MTTITIPHWKIKGLQRASSFLQFDSFDIFPSNRRAGLYCSALIRSGLIEAVSVDYFGNNKYELTSKGLSFINSLKEKGLIS